MRVAVFLLIASCAHALPPVACPAAETTVDYRVLWVPSSNNSAQDRLFRCREWCDLHQQHGGDCAAVTQTDVGESFACKPYDA